MSVDLTSEQYEKHREAGEILAQVREEAAEMVEVGVSYLRQLLIEVLGRPEPDDFQNRPPSIRMFKREVGNHHLCAQVQHVVFADQFPVRVRPVPLLGERSFYVAIEVILSSVVRREAPCVVQVERDRVTTRAALVGKNLGVHLPAVTQRECREKVRHPDPVLPGL